MGRPKWFTLNVKQRGNLIRWHPSNGWFIDHVSEQTGAGLRCLNGEALGPSPLGSVLRIYVPKSAAIVLRLLVILMHCAVLCCVRCSCLNFG
eukprot:SAG22_NODE_4_length_44774_cov_362.122149_1_plen_91_part_10